MKLRYLWALLFILFISTANATDLEVEKFEKGNVIVAESGNPAVFDFVITNNLGGEETVEIYSLIGVTFSPRGTFDLRSGKNFIEVKAYLPENLLRNRGLLNLEYQIKGQKSGILRDNFVVRIVSLDEVFTLEANDIKFKDQKAVVKVRNTQNSNFEDVNFDFDSVFFVASGKESFKPFEEKNFSILINKDIQEIVAGHYFINAEVSFGDSKNKISGIVDYLEKEVILSDSKSKGLIFRKTTLTNKNEGNKESVINVETRKNIITRLFTTFSEEPSFSERKGLFVNYMWSKNLKPGDEFNVVVSTNYTYPFILLILVVLIAFFVRVYTFTNVVANKSINFVKTKGGEFALRVKLRIKARRAVKNLQIIDLLPNMTKLYENFGKAPDKIDEKTRRLYWKIGDLNAGEERSISYIIYSKIRTVGRFELSSARVVYQKDGKNEEVYSNRAYFVSEVSEED